MQAVLIKGASGYGALGLFLDALAAAFARRGYVPVVIDTTQEPDLAAALRLVAAQGPVALVFSYVAYGEFRSAEGLSVGELAGGAPHVIQYVDYPLTHALRLDQTPPETAVLVIDQSHVDAITAAYGAGRFAHVGFCPHAAVGEPVAIPEAPAAWAAARPIPILFAGTCYRPGPPPWRDFAPPVAKLFDSAFEIALAADWLPAMEALRQAVAVYRLDLDAPELNDLRRGATFLHERVRADRRRQLMETAARMGLPLTVFGKGWEGEVERLGNVSWGGEAGLEDVLQLMAHARLVLNVNANFGAGSHERPLSALLAGAAAASDHSRFWEAQFADAEMRLYRWSALEDGLEQVARLAADPEAGCALARAGQARVMAGHRFDHRVDAILAAAEAGRARLSAATAPAARALAV